jgi:hypothetical protein
MAIDAGAEVVDARLEGGEPLPSFFISTSRILVCGSMAPRDRWRRVK